MLGALSLSIPAAVRAALGVLICDPNAVSGVQYLYLRLRCQWCRKMMANLTVVLPICFQARAQLDG